MVNLRNCETKDFAELWKIIHLKIWTHFSIRQSKLFWINLKYYNQTCSNDHLCKMTTHLRQPMLNPPRQFLMQSLLCKTTTCLTWPATTFWVPNEKKKKYPAKRNLSSKEMWYKQEQCRKNKRLWLYLLCCYFIMQSLFNVYKSCQFKKSVPSRFKPKKKISDFLELTCSNSFCRRYFVRILSANVVSKILCKEYYSKLKNYVSVCKMI